MLILSFLCILRQLTIVLQFLSAMENRATFNVIIAIIIIIIHMNVHTK
jgi:hypothetical protein